MNGENKQVFYPYKEGKDPLPEKAILLWESAIKLAHKYFDETNLVLAGKITEKELSAIGDFLAEVALVSPTLNTGTQIHFHLTKEYMEQFVLAYKERNKDSQIGAPAACCAALLHDIGRIFSHRSFRNDLLGEHFLKVVGLRDEIVRMIPDDRRWLAKHLTQGEKNKYGTTPVQDMMELADVLGKPPTDGKFLRPENIFGYEQQRNVSDGTDWGSVNWKNTGMWPSEFNRQRSVNLHRILVQNEYRRIVNWVEAEVLGGPIEGVITKVEERWKTNPFTGFIHSA